MGTTIRPVLCATLIVWLLAGAVGSRVAVAAGADDADLRGTSRVAGKPAANAVVWLDAPGAPRTTGSTIALEQRNMAFFPRVLAAQVGTVVELMEGDRDRCLRAGADAYLSKPFSRHGLLDAIESVLTAFPL